MRPEQSIRSSQLFFPPIDNRYRVSARRSEKRNHNRVTVEVSVDELLKKKEELLSVIKAQKARIDELERAAREK